MSLDLIGRIPTVAEVREFLADTAADKREKLVEKLLLDAQHHTHFARLCATSSSRRRPPPEEYLPFETWLREQFRENRRYDQFARTS